MFTPTQRQLSKHALSTPLTYLIDIVLVTTTHLPPRLSIATNHGARLLTGGAMQKFLAWPLKWRSKTKRSAYEGNCIISQVNKQNETSPVGDDRIFSDV